MSRLPLEHMRILDLTQAWAGSYALQLVADLGAEVIKVESRSRPDGWRGGFDTSRGVACYPADGPGEHPYNRSYLANSVNRNKYGITLDLTTVEGRQMFLDLVRVSDAVTENFTPRVMGNLGIGYEKLREMRADIVLLSMPAFGLSGPYRDFPGNGGTIEAMSSSITLLGEVDGDIQTSGIMYPDPIAGMNGAAALLSALYRRQLTGEGCHIEVSQQEAMIAMLGEFFEDGQPAMLTRLGNRDLLMAPHGIFQCAGKEDWLALAVRNDSDWSALVELIGDEQLRLGQYATVDGRKADETAIEERIGKWCATRPGRSAEVELAGAGIPAARVRAIEEVIACPQLNGTGYFQPVAQPEGIPPAIEPGILVRLEDTPGSVRLLPVSHGEHSREVLQRLLGIQSETLDELEHRGVIGAGPPPA